jgi:hypothetical protein
MSIRFSSDLLEGISCFDRDAPGSRLCFEAAVGWLEPRVTFEQCRSIE